MDAQHSVKPKRKIYAKRLKIANKDFLKVDPISVHPQPFKKRSDFLYSRN